MKATSKQVHLRYAGSGLFMGVALSQIGFTDYDEVHKMFTFADPRLLLTFAGAVALGAVGVAVFARGHVIERKKLRPGTIPGAMLFGIGWALTGSCPSIALVPLGQGYLPAGLTILGIVTGVTLYRAFHRRFFRWDTGACR